MWVRRQRGVAFPRPHAAPGPEGWRRVSASRFGHVVLGVGETIARSGAVCTAPSGARARAFFRPPLRLAWIERLSSHRSVWLSRCFSRQSNRLEVSLAALVRWVGRAIGLDVHRDFCVVAIYEEGGDPLRWSGVGHARGDPDVGGEPVASDGRARGERQLLGGRQAARAVCRPGQTSRPDFDPWIARFYVKVRSLFAGFGSGRMVGVGGARSWFDTPLGRRPLLTEVARDAAALASLKRFTGAVLILEGEFDCVIPHAVIDAYRETCRDARYEVLAGATHRLTSPQHKQRFVDLLIEWFGAL
jgi:pimeloyl-ACP methyl ester carboxylesterase